MPSIFCVVAWILPILSQVPEPAGALQTVAERSGYRATARYEEVASWCREFARATPNARLTELGRTSEGRSIPLLIVADPPVKTAAEAARSGKLLCLMIGDIHAGEVCGKEALPMLLREVFATPHPPLLKDLILAVAPIYNADGNERVSKTNRPGQVGPEEGMGQRGNARGLDLNRDFVKLEAPETRGLVRFLNEWNPHLFIDTHTTDGSYHRYMITYEGPKNPAGDPRIIAFMRRTFFPKVGAAFEKRTGLKAFPYGNFNRDHTRWTTFPAEARYGTTYVGLRNRLSVLSEAYSHAPYETRVLATRDFVRDCLEVAASQKAEIFRLLAAARTAAGRWEESSRGPTMVPIRSRARAAKEPATILGFEERQEAGRRVRTDTPKDYTVELVSEFEAAESVPRPFAYLIPPAFDDAVATLQRHGLDVQELREDVELDLEVYRVEAIERSPRRFEGHHPVELRVSRQPVTRMVPAGTRVVKTAQPQGALVVGLLEPRSEDGLATWNAFDAGLNPGGEFPVLRLPRSVSLFTTAAQPLAEDRSPPRPITFEMAGGGGRGRGGFGFGAQTRWLDGQHWLQARDGRLLKVHAASGRTQPFFDARALAQGLARLPGLDQQAAQSIARRTSFDMDPPKRGFLFEHDQDLFYTTFDGSTAVRLTNQPGREQWPQFSPDGKLVAFVRDFDLFVVEVRGGPERRLTTGGRDDLRHGHADWVYFEEIWNRRWPSFWWSPDSKHLAFLEFDDTSVPHHTVLDDASSATGRIVEQTRYPRSGESNPKVRLGLVAGSGGPVQWADLADYSPDSSLISEVGWWPDSSAAYCYMQNRTQTWLDLVKVTPSEAEGATKAPVKRLFRDATRAWIDSPGRIHAYQGRSFLWLSERDGWKHIYQYGADGKLQAQLTSGPWEVRGVEHVDLKDGWIYFTATRDSPTAVNFYRVKPGKPIERLTPTSGSHTVNMSPDGTLFLASWSDIETPTRIRLYGADGRRVRTVDSNPSYELKQYRFGPRQRLRIPARDGFPLEAELILPPDLDPARKYPVWFMTYGGPHFPRISDSWGGGHLWDHALAHEGFVVFHMDPRSASGKGAVSAWTAYKHLGVQELEDIKDAIAWLKKKPYVDGSRIGMSGHSYGGFMTSFAMTHSDLFAAGIAGAPVTDWRDYDSIYTERYMGLPQDNPDGYDATSVVKAARNLHGKLLILHGAIDDNVSVRNTMRLVEALQDANKDFELMIYPSSRHGIFGPHYNRIQIDFIRRTLGTPKPEKAQSGSPGDLATQEEEGRARPESRRRRAAAAGR
ncbi:MAG TPA: DPP IV N-terminal domain-containing protein [Isosphaeraceae bacterium]|nr:DPP IV N-terminal domain-containing protein [Isosphaeraceae bacterium]